ncbi:MAG: DUF1015 domain-containing protein [Candidatus Glassbacteria bacterium]|nr:DUF1015 domain-containing protein [Candidatus Glassbacteria bacterium]
MAEIFPFRGVSFDPAKAGPFDELVTQPYDKISTSDRERYLARSPYSIARLICSAPSGADLRRHFAGVADLYNRWLDDGVLVRSDKPCIYPYHQTYRVPGTGEQRTRRGFVGLGRLHDYADGVVRPHEKTHSGPKADRLELTRATGSQFGQLFMLYHDPQGEVNGVLEQATGSAEPVIEVTEGDGTVHRMWRIDNPEATAEVQRLMAGRSLYIADGHHRYETALAYCREMAANGVPVTGNEAIDRAMMSFVSAHDPGLSVLPTHRVLFGLEGFSVAGLLEKLAADFEISDAGEPNAKNLLAALDNISGGRKFLLAARGHGTLVRLALKSSSNPDKLIPGAGSGQWKGLDVNLLHKLIFEHRLGISAEDLEHQRNVAYLRDPAEALEMVTAPDGKYQAVFFLNPTGVDEVVAVADNGEFMPQKSTDFYPKMLTGMVINKINLDQRRFRQE